MPHASRPAQVIDPVTDYLKLLRSIFDFPALKALFARPDFKFLFDGLHGVAGCAMVHLNARCPCTASHYGSRHFQMRSACVSSLFALVTSSQAVCQETVL